MLLVCATGITVALTIYESRSLWAQAGHLRQAEPGWCVLAVSAEGVSLVAYAVLVRELLKLGGLRARLRGLLRATLGGIAMNNSLPAGQGVSLAYWYKQLRHEGAERGLAVLAMAGSTAVSVLSLGGLLVLGVAVAGSTGPLAAVHVWIIAAGAGVLLARCVFHRPLTRLLGRTVHRFASGTVVEPGPGRLVAIASLGYVNWLLDCACLWASLTAVHAHAPARSVLLVYALAQIVANIPLLPGGGGTVEVSLAIAFAAFSDHTANIVAACCSSASSAAGG